MRYSSVSLYVCPLSSYVQLYPARKSYGKQIPQKTGV